MVAGPPSSERVPSLFLTSGRKKTSNPSPSKAKSQVAKENAARRKAEKDAQMAKYQGKKAQLDKVKVRTCSYSVFVELSRVLSPPHFQLHSDARLLCF